MTVGSQVRSCYSSIKSAEATILLLGNKTQNEETKKIFEETQRIITEIKDDLKDQVMHLSQEEPQYK